MYTNCISLVVKQKNHFGYKKEPTLRLSLVQLLQVQWLWLNSLRFRSRCSYGRSENRTDNQTRLAN